MWCPVDCVTNQNDHNWFLLQNLTVLYLYDNRINKIEHLEQVPNLHMLYLQKNRISVIENLTHLKKLKKLYLSNNKISFIENLDDLRSLVGKKAKDLFWLATCIISIIKYQICKKYLIALHTPFIFRTTCWQPMSVKWPKFSLWSENVRWFGQTTASVEHFRKPNGGSLPIEWNHITYQVNCLYMWHLTL